MNFRKVFIAVFVGLSLAIFIGTLIQPKNTIQKYRQEKYQEYEQFRLGKIYDTPEDISGCMIWALGDDWLSIKERDIPNHWNERHGDLFKLYLDDDYWKSQARIYKAWKEHMK